jgi:hypothetical protein
VKRLATIGLLGMALAACGTAGTSSAPGASTGGQPTAIPGGGGDGGQTSEGLCGAVTEEMAVAALGGPVAEPTGGDVLPRPNGIYCRYSLAADANVNVEAQLKEMTRAEFDELVTTLALAEPLAGVGEAGFQREGSLMGGPGVAIAAFGGGRGVTVVVQGEGDADAQLAAASAIAGAALAS